MHGCAYVCIPCVLMHGFLECNLSMVCVIQLYNIAEAKFGGTLLVEQNLILLLASSNYVCGPQ